MTTNEQSTQDLQDIEANDVARYLLPPSVYLVLKWLGLIALPAIATFVGTLGIAVGWDGCAIAVVALTGLGTLIGVLIGASQVTGGSAK